ncbi:MAG: pyruvate carboxylase subunit B [Syntrophomonadaceae bacterium]|nr:pyruvate carboxylase subunit B [Syntrophomonadaceae bacterium]
MKRLGVTDTTLRDGHQSLWATRMRVDDMLPILERIDDIGYHSLEVWGGATFDVCVRFLDEDPWERLRVIRQKVKKTKLQMLLRGQSLVGYSHYPDDVVERFVVKAAENGIDIFRIFDALNDIRNLEKAMQVAKETGKHVQASVVYTISPVHTLDHYVETALKLEDRGADSICIKDMAGLLSPYRAFELISGLKARLQIPVQLHTHYTGGMAVATYVKAAEAGVDIVDTASGPLAFGSSQPPAETVVRILQESSRDTGLNLSPLFEVSEYFEDVRIKRGFERGITRISAMRVFEHQVPGGMISNLVAQLKEQQASERLPEVLLEIARVRKELGYPPLVTPTSQIVGTQAAVNVITGKRYGMVPGEVRKYVQGFYGKVPGEIDPDIKKKILGKTEAIACRPADLIPARLGQCRNEIGDLATTEEDLLTYALFPMVARKFLEEKKNRVAETKTE